MRFAAIEREIRAAIPPDEIEMLIDNIGIPNSWPSIAQGDIPTISSADGEILISLNKEKHGSSRDYEVLLRKRLRDRFPDMDFFFQPANITSQILNFGLPAPIDLQVVGRNAEANYKIAQKTGQAGFPAFREWPTCMFTRWRISPRSAWTSIGRRRRRWD